MQDPACELPRIPIPRTPVNRGKKKGRRLLVLRRRTSSPETLLYASESPAGAGPSWCTRTSLVAQTARHATVAEVAHEAVARARLIPEDVRLVTAKVVADYGVVGGLRRSSEERVRRDYDPARDGGGAGGDVAREMVARNFHATGAHKRYPDPREIPVELRGSTRARIVLDRVGFHLELTYRLGRESFEEHASAVVVDRVSGEDAAMGGCDVDAPRATRDVVANNLCVHGFRAFHVNPCKTGTANIVGEDLGPGGVLFDEHASPVAYEIIPRDSGIDDFLNLDRVSEFRVASDNIVHDLGVAVAVVDIDAFADFFLAAYEMVLRDSSVDAPASADPDSGIAYETVSPNSSVASGVNVDHVHRVAPRPFNLEAPESEARNAHIAHARPGELAVFDIHVAEDANSLRSSGNLRAGRVCFGSGGRFDHRVVSAQLYPVLADYYVLSVNSPDHDSVARMGSVYGLLDGLARPNDRALRSGGADLGDGQGHPTCHQHRQSHGGQQHYGASHKQTRLPSGGRRKKGVRPPPRYVTKAAYSCLRGVYVRHGTKYYRAPRKHRTS